MRNILITFLCGMIPGATMASASESQASEDSSKTVYQGTAQSLRGEEIALESFKGKVSLIVNTASKCGFTGQYEALEKLYQTYKDRGFVVLGFPSNDFGGQEPGSNEEIGEFCKLNFGVSFPIFEKNPVKGENKQTVFKTMTEHSHKDFNGDPGWNFVKFVVDKNGFVRGRFSSMTKPDNKKLQELIEKLLIE
ncbi:MAG TPA: glutathione peroxidase [Oligoflexia bacterium]|nr:glutathione peroxidase [Oligoflexia bacterium]HMP47045.1 glutathione peroxidase [Oligoflexia bacterium]